jgi:AbrB family looped-hinge helix DNA binding protein
MHEYRTKINENGRLVIPAAYRKALGIKTGDEVVLRIEEEELHISNTKNALKRARRLVKQYINDEINLTESLITDRRKETAHE